MDACNHFKCIPGASGGPDCSKDPVRPVANADPALPEFLNHRFVLTTHNCRPVCRT
mgnify:CR=1 FL=1